MILLGLCELPVGNSGNRALDGRLASRPMEAAWARRQLCFHWPLCCVSRSPTPRGWRPPARCPLPLTLQTAIRSVDPHQCTSGKVTLRAEEQELSARDREGELGVPWASGECLRVDEQVPDCGFAPSCRCHRRSVYVSPVGSTRAAGHDPRPQRCCEPEITHHNPSGCAECQQPRLRHCSGCHARAIPAGFGSPRKAQGTSYSVEQGARRVPSRSSRTEPGQLRGT